MRTTDPRTIRPRPISQGRKPPRPIGKRSLDGLSPLQTHYLENNQRDTRRTGSSQLLSEERHARQDHQGRTQTRPDRVGDAHVEGTKH